MPPAATLVTAFWVAALIYALFQGLYYGVKSALFMDVTNPRVAATRTCLGCDGLASAV